jgi:hypothetical protein
MCLYRVIINDCPIAVGVENPHTFLDVPPASQQTSRQISITASSATPDIKLAAHSI